MMHRDRAWRRKQGRLSTLHSEFVDDIRSHPPLSNEGKPMERPHQHGKLTPTQAMRLDGQLRTDVHEGFS